VKPATFDNRDQKRATGASQQALKPEQIGIFEKELKKVNGCDDHCCTATTDFLRHGYIT
jgi:hypothetical protein